MDPESRIEPAIHSLYDMVKYIFKRYIKWCVLISHVNYDSTFFQLLQQEQNYETDSSAASFESDSDLDNSLPPVFQNVRRELFPVRKKYVFIKGF